MRRLLEDVGELEAVRRERVLVLLKVIGYIFEVLLRRERQPEDGIRGQPGGDYALPRAIIGV